MADSYRLTGKANADLSKIWADIAQRNSDAADKLYFRILSKIENASINPGIGSPRPEIGADVRLLVEGNYKIVYVPDKVGILVTAIVHTRRDFSANQP